MTATPRGRRNRVPWMSGPARLIALGLDQADGNRPARMTGALACQGHPGSVRSRRAWVRQAGRNPATAANDTCGPAGRSGLVDAEDDFGGLDEHRDRLALGETQALSGGAGDRRHDLLAGDIHGDLRHHRAELHVLDGPVELVSGTEPHDLLPGSSSAGPGGRLYLPSPTGAPAADAPGRTQATWTKGRCRRSGSAARSTSRVTG